MIRRTTRAAALLLVLAAPARALAQDSADVQVWAIRATTKNSEISPDLRPLVEQLKRSFKFTGYKLEKRAAGRPKTNDDFSADLIGGYRVGVTPLERDKGRLKLRLGAVRVVEGKERPLLRTTITLDSGKFQILGGDDWKLDGGDVLIVAVSAR